MVLMYGSGYFFSAWIYNWPSKIYWKKKKTIPWLEWQLCHKLLHNQCLGLFSGLFWALWAVHSYTNTAKSLQSCPTLCNPIDGSPPGSPVPGILQARTLEWAAISFSNAWKWKVKVKSLSPVWLFSTPWTAARQAPPSMGFSRQEYWRGGPLPSPVLFTIPLPKNDI